MKKHLTLILIMLLTLLSSVPAAASEVGYCGFKDVGDAVWYADAVRFVSDNELMVGTDSEQFGPDTTLTRAQFVTILWRMAGEPDAGETSPAFNDVETGSWYEAAVNWSAEKDLVTGYGNGRFGPADPVTRQQIAVLFWRMEGQPSAGDADLSGFTDADEISSWAQDAAGWAVETGLLHGNGSQLQPLGIATRAEAAQILMNKQAEGTLPAPFTQLQDYLTWADEVGYPEGLLDSLGAAGINQDYFHTPAESDAYTSGRIVIGDSRCCQLGIYEQRTGLSDFAVYAVWGGHYAPGLTPMLLREDLLAAVQDCFEAQIRACGKCTIYFFATVNDNEYENNENEERIAAALQAAEGFASMSVKVNGKTYHPDMVLIGFDGGSVSSPILGRIEPEVYNRYVAGFNEAFLSRTAESEILAPFSSGFTTVPVIMEKKTAFNADGLHYSDGTLDEIISFITGG
ncbi:MAG: S-layer homology domain-containing protein [Firmicutes bacterium]|nr:S-layer homology domain-containing protein [Bacillota bacterium]